MLALPRHRQRLLLPARRPRTRATTWTSPARQQPQPGPPERAAADHGLAALLGDRVPRRRVPLRPRVGARARVPRGRPPLGVLRHHPPGPGPLAGEADRRAVGRRAGRLPGRQLPGPLDGVERHVPRRDARLLARPRAASATSPTRFAGSADLYETRRPPAVRVDQLRHRARRLHARTTSSRTTRSTTRRTARTTATAPTTTASWNCGVEGPTDDPEVIALRARQQRNFLATLLLSQGVPMLLGGDEIGRTQRRQQQRLLPGQRDLVDRLGPRRATSELLEFTRRLIALRRDAPGVPPHAASSTATRRRAGPARRLVVPPRRPQMTRRDWDDGRVARARRVPERRRSSGRRRARRGGARRLVPAPLQRPPRAGRVHAARPALRAALEARARRPRHPDCEATAAVAGARTVDASSRARSRCSAAVLAPAARDLPPAARPGVRLRTTRASSCRTCATSASATSTSRRSLQARAGSTHGYDVVDPTPRLRASSAARTSSARSCAARASASSSTSSRTTWRRATRTRSGATRELRARFFDLDPATGWHRRFFDIDDLAGVRVEDPEVFEATHRKVLELVARGLVDGLRIDHPDGLAEPGAGTSSGCATRRRARLGREDPRAGRAAARLAGRGHDRLRVRERRARRCSSNPAAEDALTELLRAS